MSLSNRRTALLIWQYTDQSVADLALSWRRCSPVSSAGSSGPIDSYIESQSSLVSVGSGIRFDPATGELTSIAENAAYTQPAQLGNTLTSGHQWAIPEVKILKCCLQCHSIRRGSSRLTKVPQTLSRIGCCCTSDFLIQRHT